MKAALPALNHSLIVPNAPHFEFDFVIATDGEAACSSKDFDRGCCVHPLNQSEFSWADSFFSSPGFVAPGFLKTGAMSSSELESQSEESWSDAFFLELPSSLLEWGE